MAGISMPILYALPTVRSRFASLTELVTGREADSLFDWRFVGVYLVSIASLSVGYVLAAITFAVGVGRVTDVSPSWQFARVTLLLGAVAVAAATTGLLVYAVRRRGFRAVAEWLIFLCFAAVLTGLSITTFPYYAVRVLSYF
ncbi:hypothetical protein [Haloprofundus marisrubri]|nr:hypothetical protein [Haloprofundus marisrubri]